MMKKLAVFVCLMILASLTLSAQMQAKPGMCEKKAQVLLDKVLELFNKGNIAVIPEIYTADVTARTSTFPDEFVGHEGIKKWVEMSRMTFPDMVMTFDSVVVQPDLIATIWTLTATQSGPMPMPNGTLPPTGTKVRFTGMSFDWVKDGKLVREIVVYNVLELLMQLGFTLNPPQVPVAK
jgi:predicted ester cyclase